MGMVSSSSLKHRELWERFAEQDARKYIMTDLPANAPDVFWTSGETTVRDELLPMLKTVSFQTDCCLEIGCGIGRLLLPLSKFFDRAIGVDVSEGMVVRARESARNRGITNVQFARIGEPPDLTRFFSAEIGQVTFVYSLLVFQHIPDFRVIQAYIAI